MEHLTLFFCRELEENPMVQKLLEKTNPDEVARAQRRLVTTDSRELETFFVIIGRYLLCGHDFLKRCCDSLLLGSVQ